MEAIKTKSFELDGYTARISIYHDPFMGAPWEEHDGHGIVTGWERRDKRAGERVLTSDRSSSRFYDIPATIKKAKAEGWGLGEEAKAKLAAKLGRTPTVKEITAEAVERDFEYCRGWCNNDWHWLGYTTTIETPDGGTIEGDSCWGFEGDDEGEKYMAGEAEDHARYSIEEHKKLVAETLIAAACP